MIVEIDANPSAGDIVLCRMILARHAVDPDDPWAVTATAAHCVSPQQLATAANQLAVTLPCVGECGENLDVSDKDALALRLCAACYEEAGLENEHSDGMHQHGKHPDCPDCNGRG